jgi:hypothetical protein
MELDSVIVGSFLPPRACYSIDLTAMLSSLFTAGTLTGFDASGHIAEETKNARSVFGFDGSLLLFLRILLQCRCWPRHHKQRHCHRRARFHNDHPVPLLYPRPGHVLRARCPSTIRASVRARLRKGAQYLHDHSRCAWSHNGAHPFKGLSPENSRVVTEHQHRRCGVLPTGLRRRARRRLPALRLGRARHLGRTAEERGHGDVRVRGGAVVHHPPESGRVHLAGIGERGADHRGVRPHRAAAPHADAARLQVFAFLSRALGPTDVPLDSAVQWARFCCASFLFFHTAQPR